MEVFRSVRRHARAGQISSVNAQAIVRASMKYAQSKACGSGQSGPPFFLGGIEARSRRLISFFSGSFLFSRPQRGTAEEETSAREGPDRCLTASVSGEHGASARSSALKT